MAADSAGIDKNLNRITNSSGNIRETDDYYQSKMDDCSYVPPFHFYMHADKFIYTFLPTKDTIRLKINVLL